jgi:hypothetical protein
MKGIKIKKEISNQDRPIFTNKDLIYSESIGPNNTINSYQVKGVYYLEIVSYWVSRYFEFYSKEAFTQWKRERLNR